MAPIKISRIISVSSEDPKYPASNLLKEDVGSGCWKCKDPGEKQAVVIMQLEESFIINGVDIGNENSAFVEVLVARSASPDSYQVLVIASSLMTVQESRSGTNKNGVRFFKYENLSKPAVDESWDRIKIVCSQPFSDNSQYGLSFIKFHSKAEKTSSHTEGGTMKLGKFSLRPDTDGGIIVGSLFAKRKEIDEPCTAAASIRQASLNPVSTSLLSKLSINDKIKSKKSPSSGARSPVKKQKVDETSENENMTGRKAIKGKLLYTEEEQEEEQPRQKNQKLISSSSQPNVTKPKTKSASKRTSSPKHKRKANDAEVSPKTKIQSPKKSGPTRRPFNELFKGVVFVISGFQNPYRSELRSKAVEMGAKYKADWDRCCTHLICAFTNTPKYNQVLGHGHIVKKDWIEESYTQRKRLPWKKYALNQRDVRDSESDVEMWEEENENDNIKPENEDSDVIISGSDTEDDIEKVTASIKTRSVNTKSIPEDDSVYDKDTDTEDNEGKGTALTLGEHDDKNCVQPQPNGRKKFSASDSSDTNEMPSLPNFFDNKKFYLHTSLEEDTRKMLRRYIIAYKGNTTADASNADYVIAEKPINNFEASHAEIVTPRFVWDCNDNSILLATDPYRVA